MNDEKKLQIEKERLERKSAVCELYRLDLLKCNFIEDDFEGYTKELIKGVLANNNKIDEIISSCLVRYTIDRLSYVDRAIIRVATFEMLNGIKSTIAINEAINLTKELSNLDDDKQKAFNNSVLDKISKRI